MPQTIPWHEDDTFWADFAQNMFSDRRLSSTPAEVDLVVALLGVEPGIKILDLCCGPGRHSLELARRGFHVTGVDRTGKYLEQARENARAEGLEVEFVQEDMRTFCRPDSFNTVINMFTSFGYFEDPEEDRQVVINVHRSLKTGGLFLMDMMGKEVLAHVFRERDWSERDGIILLQERKVSQDWGWIWNRWIMLKGNERIERELSHRLYAATEIVPLLQECGFTPVNVYGGLDGSPYDHTARRMVTVARK